jgi:dipeptidyl aminopeptidase/acylaminoacyl peptidase
MYEFAPGRKQSVSTEVCQVIFMSVKRIRVTAISVACAAILSFGLPVGAQTTYQKPPKEILDVMNAPVVPTGTVSPSGDYMIISRQVGYPTIADLAQPMLRLAAIRINPATSGPHNVPSFTDFVVKRISDGKEVKVALPAEGRFSPPRWSPDGKRFIFTQTTRDAIRLWTGDTTGAIHMVPEVHINAVLAGGGGRGGGGGGCEWMGGSTKLLCKTVVAGGRNSPPPTAKVPLGPHVEESFGRSTSVATLEDLLTNAHDEDLFDYYATSQIATIDLADNKVTPIGKPAIYAGLNVSPDGKYILETHLHRQDGHYSYLLGWNSFPRETEILDLEGRVVFKVVSIPLEDNLQRGVQFAGRRDITWKPTDPASLVWAEALDGGDSRKQVPQRDKVMWLKAPFKADPSELLRTENRFGGISWGERPDFAMYRESNMRPRRTRTYFFNPQNPAEAPKLAWDLNSDDRYKNPGNPMNRELANGHPAARQEGDFIFLEGMGSGPDGDHPFVDKFNVKTLTAERLFQCPDKAYENVVALLTPDGSKFMTRHESPTDVPNYFVHTAGSTDAKAFTHFADPTPQIRGIHRELVKYTRADGIPLSMWVYTPADYKPGTRLPAVFWAYPREIASADLAGEVTGSQYRFTTIRGYSELYFLLEGYVVLDDDNAMPVVTPKGGDPEKVNDTYIDQIVEDAKAAVAKAADMGVIDPKRVGVGGHSYGAFMTANLMTHSDIFRAAIAESGAYNRTLTPFEFQSERRTIWEVPDTYLKMSPFMFADKLKAPILLIHGEADDNPGTFPIQSERFYRAIKGNGGNVRYVTLPLEAHGYQAKETLEDVVWEKLTWFNKWVKNADANTPAAATTSGASNK